MIDLYDMYDEIGETLRCIAIEQAELEASIPVNIGSGEDAYFLLFAENLND